MDDALDEFMAALAASNAHLDLLAQRVRVWEAGMWGGCDVSGVRLVLNVCDVELCGHVCCSHLGAAAVIGSALSGQCLPPLWPCGPVACMHVCTQSQVVPPLHLRTAQHQPLLHQPLIIGTVSTLPQAPPLHPSA